MPTPAEVAAYIGAAAWLPQVFRWIYANRSKPKIRLASAPFVEIGYTSFGPIVNLTAGISVEKRDAFIEMMKLTIVHTAGDSITLTWTNLNEP